MRTLTRYRATAATTLIDTHEPTRDIVGCAQSLQFGAFPNLSRRSAIIRVILPVIHT